MDNTMNNLFSEGKQGQLRWRKIGGGSLRYINGKIIKPNETFTAALKDIPLSFLKSLVCLDKESMIQQLKVEEEAKPKPLIWSAIKSEGGEWNVIGSNDRIINENPMMEEEAIKLANALNN